MRRAKKHSRMPMVFLAFFLVLGIFTTGTFAWQSISQQARNQAIGIPGPAGGRLHHNFQVMGPNFGEHLGSASTELQWGTGVRADQGVYVENFETLADYGRDIFLRVRLYEYMEFGQGANLHPGEAGFDDRLASSMIPGADREDKNTWTPRIPGPDPDGSDLFRTYWEWHMGGQKYFMPTFNRDPMSRESDVKGDAFDPQPLQAGEVQNATHRGQLYAYPLQAGLNDFFGPGSYHDAFVKWWDASLNQGAGGHAIASYQTRHEARPTLNAQVVTMAQWIEELNAQPGYFWVWDEDGWFYWAMPLPPEQATGLIINGITLRQDSAQQWFYAIFVDAEMAVSNQWQQDAPGYGWFHDPARAPTANASALLARITGVPA